MGKASFRKVLTVTGLAALGGYLAGILTAPKSGKETRADLGDAAQAGFDKADQELFDAVAELSNLLESAKSQAADLSDKARAEFEEATAKAKMARDKAREVLSAVHEGGAKDNDLNLAVVQANRALNHLREYLKK
jgi:gas vesicle protein